jgi:hypothetical protein
VENSPSTPAAGRFLIPRWPDAVVYGPVLVAILYLLPRLIHAQFGLLDDAVTLSVSRTVLAHPAFGLHAFDGQGRFLPGYWLYWSLLYASGGESPLWFYLGNTAVLALTVAALIALLRKSGAGVFETWTASLFFIFSAPVAECYFTLSKGEPTLLLALLASLLLAHRASRSRRPLVCWIFAAVLMLLAITSREPAAAWIGVVGAWLLLSCWRGFGKPLLLSRQALAVYLLVLLAGAAPALAVITLLRRTLPAGSYSSAYRLTWLNIAQSILNWSYSLIRDYPALCLFLLIAAMLAWRRQLRRPQALLLTLAWMAGFVAILLPWRDFHPYYQLMFCAGSSLFCGLMAGECLALAREGWGWARLALAAAAVLFAITAVDSANAAHYQIQVDDANADLLERLQKLPPDSIVSLNFPFDHEYAFELKLHLNEHLGRPDLRFAPLDFASPDPRDAGHPRFVVSPNLTHELWPLVRGPMLETAAANWDRLWEQASGARPAVQVTRTWQMADIGLQAFWCAAVDWLRPPLASVPCHSIPRPPVDLRQTSYGWSIYAYPAWKDPVRAASFTADGVWSIEQAEPVRLALGAPGDLPVAADWDGDGLLEPGVYRPSSNRWLIDLNLDGRPSLVFQLPGMQPGDLPVAGHWNGGLKAGPGFYRPADGSWHLFDSPGSPAEALPAIHFGSPGAVPLAGDWNGEGRSTPGLYQPETGTVTLIDSFREDAPRLEYTLPPGAPVVVNWTGVGVDTVNTVDHGKWTRSLANCQCQASNPLTAFSTALSEGRLFAGRWKTVRPALKTNRP